MKQQEYSYTSTLTGLALCLVMGICERPSQAQESHGPGINVTTVLSAEVRPADLEFADPLVRVFTDSEEGTWQFEVKRKWDAFSTALGDEKVRVTVDVPGSWNQAAVRAYIPQTDAIDQDALAAWLQIKQPFAETADGHWVVPFGAKENDSDVKSLGESSAERREAFLLAKNSVADSPLRISVVPPAHVWRTLQELMPELPKQFGGGPSRVLTSGVVWAGIGWDLKSLSSEAVIQSRDEASAKAFAQFLPTMLKSVLSGNGNTRGNRSGLPGAEVVQSTLVSWVDELSIEVKGDQVLVRLPSQIDTPQGAAMVASLANAVVGPIGARVKSNRFKQIGLAIHNYESANRVLPVAARHRDENGVPFLSWRVHVLPFFGKEGVELWKKFALNEPWDSETNLPLLKEMPDVYSRFPVASLVPKGEKVGYTTFVAPQSEDAVLNSTKVVRFQNVVDGTSNTVFIVDVQPELAVPWTAPRDYQFDSENPGKGLAIENGVFIAGVSDGSVHFIDEAVNTETLDHLFRMNDNHPIDWSEIHK